ncbi:hypothetical protein B484DRAFT_399935 [Ochromonadaceae sp. CCMP2298]|nr:hypothetical protein B484DRAFT_399935 [Ochromonadaceae sp. CCMP2298]
MMLHSSKAFRLARTTGSRMTRLHSTAGSEEVKVYLLEYTYVPGIAEKRTPHRPGHLALATKYLEAGSIKYGGAFTPNLEGALFVFKSTRSTIEEFVKQDPYYTAGLVPSYAIKEWSVAVGEL